MFKKYPFVKQTGKKDCGVACLSMILSYYKSFVPSHLLYDMTKTSKNGTTAYHLLEAAKELGMETRGVQVSFSKIQKEELILPCIASVLIDGIYQHYVVIYQFGEKKITIGDPAIGIRSYSYQEFEAIYQGVLLFLYPVRHLPNYPHKSSFFFYLLELMKPYRRLLLKLTVLSFFMTFLSIISSFYLRNLMEVIVRESQSYFFFVVVLFGLVLFLRLVYQCLRGMLFSFLNYQLDTTLTCDIFKRILTLPYTSYRNRTTGEWIARMNDLETVKQTIGNALFTVFVDGILALVTALYLLQMHSTLFFLLLLLFLLFFLLATFGKRKLQKQMGQLKEERAQLTSYMVESIQGFETVKGLNLEAVVQDHFETFYCRHLNRLFQFQIWWNFQLFGKDLLYQFGYFLLVAIATFLVLKGELTSNDMLVFQALALYILNPLQNILEFHFSYQEAKNAISRVAELQPVLETEGFLCPKIEEVTFQKLSYPKENPFLVNLNIVFKKGEKILLLGSSGSGKSTLLKLVKGYYDDYRGDKKINQRKEQQYQKQSISKRISYISQDEILFTDTIYHNITLHRLMEQEDFLEIMKLCEVEEIVEQKPLGYSQLLEENGFNISGGQKDRMILARTLLQPFDVLLIDEGLSQVDPNMERRILKRLFQKYPEKLILIVSHRRDNLDLFERVITMENGKIIQDIRKER